MQPTRAAGLVTALATWRWTQQPNCLWLEVETSSGVVGLGETYYLPGATEAILHDFVAPMIIGRNAEDIAVHWRSLFDHASFFGYAGAEMRAFSALDVALWDAFGQAVERPIYALLGGQFRTSIPIYNTCVDAGDFLDFQRTLHDPAQLARELVSQQISALKVWPFDRFAPVRTGGSYEGPAGPSAMGPVGTRLTRAELAEGLRVLTAIKDEIGDEADIILEGHSRWDLNTAIRISRSLEPFDLLWAEDLIQPDNPDDLRRLVEETAVPQAVSERLITRHAYRQILERRAAHVVMLDVAWTGGLTESSRIADLADAYHLPVAPHDCTGPVTAMANIHLAIGKSNVLIAETVRGFFRGYYRDVLDRPLPIIAGAAHAPVGAGLGAALSAEFKDRGDVRCRRT